MIKITGKRSNEQRETNYERVYTRVLIFLYSTSYHGELGTLAFDSGHLPCSTGPAGTELVLLHELSVTDRPIIASVHPVELYHLYLSRPVGAHLLCKAERTINI